MNRRDLKPGLPRSAVLAIMLLAASFLLGSALVVAGDTPAADTRTADTQASEKTLAQRRAYLESMPVADKASLRRNQQRFAELDEQQRQDVRDLYTSISQSPERERLLSVMRLYHQWMQSLTAGERLQLLALPAEHRLRAIKKLIERQERESFQALVQKSLSAADLGVVIDWLAELALERLPPDDQQRLRAIEHPLRKRAEIMSTYRRRAGDMNDARFLDRLKPTADDRKALLQRLSQPAQDTIAAAQNDPEKRQLVQSWVNAAVFSRRGNRPTVAQETLDAYFANLEAAEKDYLNNLPPDRKREELSRLYMRSRLRRPGEFRAPFGPNRRRGAAD